MSWVLILTLTFSESPAITAVPGFASLDACLAAGTAWRIDAKEQLPRHATPTFVCVKTS